MNGCIKKRVGPFQDQIPGIDYYAMSALTEELLCLVAATTNYERRDNPESTVITV
jgi:hypothetical protein